MDERGERRADIRAIFKGQSDRAYLFGKLEKLAHAVMLLTSRSDRDAFSLIERLELSVLDSVREAAALAVHADHSPLSSILLELVSLLRLGATAGLISEANARVLVDEYLKILSRLAAPSVQGIVLSQDELRRMISRSLRGRSCQARSTISSEQRTQASLGLARRSDRAL
jgi:hypothetical protein